MGRPRKLADKDLRDRILKAIKLGTGWYRAAELSGVSADVFRMYMRLGEQDIAADKKTIAAEFVESVHKETAKVGSLVEGSVLHAALHDRDVRAATWWLERKYPDEYGRHDKLTIDNGDLAKQLMGYLRDRLDAETYNRVLAALAPDDSEEPEILQLN